MKALVLKGRGHIEYISKDIPSLSDEHGVLLRPILVSPCTSDVHTIWQGSPKRENLTLGHECVAEVAYTGSDVKDFKAGDVVAVPALTPDWSHPDADTNPGHAGVNFSGHMLGKSIDGAFQEVFYMPHADKNLAHIPEGVSLEQALMCADVVTTGFTAAEEAGIKEAYTVAVFGIGAIGLAAIMAAKLYGAGKIFAVGSRPENVRIAQELGAEVINYKTCRCELPDGMHPMSNSTGSQAVNYILAHTGTKGADAVLICGGNDYTFPQAVDVCRYGTGIVSNVMYYGADTDTPAGDIDGIIIPKFSIGRGMSGKTLKFSLAKGGRKRMEYLLGLCRDKKINPEIFITRRYEGLESVERAIYDMKNREAIKIAVKI